MKIKSYLRARQALLAAATGLAMLANFAYAVDPIPDWKTLVFPTMVPKAGNNSAETTVAGNASGTIRQSYEQRYEKYWKETSYYDYDQLTGVKKRGYFNDTKTYGYTAVPWPIHPRVEAALGGGKLGGEAFRDDRQRTYLTYNDTRPTDRFGHTWYDTNSACLNDGAWTPGESFNDANGNGKWDPRIPAEDFWNSDSWTTAGAPDSFLQGRSTAGAKTGPLDISADGIFRLNGGGQGMSLGAVNGNTWRPDAGEVFVDWNDSYTADIALNRPGFTRTVTLAYLSGGTSQVLRANVNEMDFFPTDPAHAYAGDMKHTVVIDPTLNGVVPVDIPTNGIFDFTVSAALVPQVFATGDYVEYDAFVVVNAAADARGYYKYSERWNQAGVPSVSNTTVGIGVIRAFVYGTRELYGVPRGSGTLGTSRYGDVNPAAGRIVTADDTWTTFTAGEKFEDFISYRSTSGNMVYLYDKNFIGDPVSVGPVIVAASYGQIAPFSIVGGGRGRPTTIFWDEYEAYLRWNYPGSGAGVTALLARAYNGVYDGPEDWTESFNKKVLPTNSLTEVVTAPAEGLHWHANYPPFQFASWSEWYDYAFASNNPATPMPFFPGALQVIGHYDAVNIAGTNGGWIPSTTWSYDAPTEMCDLPSSLYHLGGSATNSVTFLGNPWTWTGYIDIDGNTHPMEISPFISAVGHMFGGDLAIGEMTSPWSDALDGHDLWTDNPSAPTGPDHIRPSGGPFAINTIAVNGFDGADMGTIELLTRRTELDPTSPDSIHPVQFRDTNLDGIWDGGDYRTGDPYYDADPDGGKPGGDGSGPYPFNRQRFMEDVIATWDQNEDFGLLGVPAFGLPWATRLYGFPIYITETNAGWAALGGPAGANVQILTRDSTVPLGIVFQVRPMGGGLSEGGGSGGPGTLAGTTANDFGMGILCHEQGHDIMGWPDLYDYDTWSVVGGLIVNSPVAGYDLMSGGGLVHGVADMKVAAGWTAITDLSTILTVGGGPVILNMYPVDRFEDQYFTFNNPKFPQRKEFLDLWYTANDTVYGVPGGAGLYITHQDFAANSNSLPIQQRVNGHFTWEVLQADGLNQLQDAVNFGDTGDPWPGAASNKTFTADGNPPSRWWDQSDTGLRILDVVIPSSPALPAQITFERYNPNGPWPWLYTFADADGDGIPDAWELHYFFDLTTANGTSDWDRDGLLDISEYLAGTDPLHRYSADPAQVVDDSIYDSDHDGLINLDEQTLNTNPQLPDTDDDGLGDGLEVARGLNPTNSLVPLADRVLNLTGSGTNYVSIPLGYNPAASSMQLALDSFTLEAWIYPRTVTGKVDIITRTLNSVLGYKNFELSLNSSRQLSLAFTHIDGTTNETLVAPAPTAIPLQHWTHVLGSYDFATHTMSLYINGTRVTWKNTSYRPMKGDSSGSGGGAFVSVVEQRVGRNFDGLIDEVRIWSQYPGDRTLTQLQEPITQPQPGLLVYYRFDDGSNSNGVSGIVGNLTGQVENYVFSSDWWSGWLNAGSLRGGAQIISAPRNAPVQAGMTDSDGDGIPDYWEILNGLNPNSAVGNDGALGDPDTDGLSNLDEFRLGYNPHDPDSNHNGILDSLEDADGDGLPNNVEINSYGSRPDLPDTDDDGLSDGEEVMGIDNYGGFLTDRVPLRKSSPIRSTDPVRMMSGSFTGNGYMIVSNAVNQGLDSWTVEAWVRPATNGSGIVIQHKVFNTIPGVTTNAINYELGLISGSSGKLRPYVKYAGLTTTGTAVEVRVDGLGSNEVVNLSIVTNLVSADQWSHIAGTYDQDGHTLRLFVNGEQVSYRTDALAPWGLNGEVDVQVYDAVTTVGGGYNYDGTVENGYRGYIDDVAISSSPLTSEILALSLQSRSALLQAPVIIASTQQTSNVQSASIATALSANYIANQFIVRLSPTFIGSSASNQLTSMGLTVLKSFQISPLYLVQAASGMTASQQLSVLRSNSNVLYAEPNYRLEFTKTPNDAKFSEMWALNNTGQTGGKSDADIDAPAAWNRSTGSKKVVVAIIDSGCDRTHPDIAPNLWVNTGEIPNNGIDDDGNGYIDDVNGYDFFNNDADPDDTIGHGTHTAGTIGAVGNNSVGTAGINWNVSLMILKVGDQFLSESAIIDAIQYAWRNGAKVSNNSYGGYGYSQGIRDAIQVAGNAGHLFVAAAGNDANDNDSSPAYPASYDLDNIISVAASDHNDDLASFSNYGANSVDIAAPGVNILSTVPGGYDLKSGTSMASPHVAGVGALLLAANPNIGYRAIKSSILASAEKKTTFAGLVLTGGRLNAANAVLQNGSFVALYSFNDGGSSVEDFTYQNGWETGWATAGYMVNAAISTNFYVQDNTDTDGDTLPDWWEIAMGLDPSNASGDQGLWGDPDGDGLSNRGEYLAGLNPIEFDTNGNGMGDYFATNSVGITYGELYDDGDLIPDSYEIQYPGFMSPLLDDASQDADMDGWDNLSEYRASTDPSSADSHPVPSMQVSVNYSGTNTLSSLLFLAYNSAGMDGIPVAIGSAAGITQNLPTVVSPVFTNGYLKQGPTWIFVIADSNGNGSYDDGEPAGVLANLPINVGFSGTILAKVGLTDGAGLSGLTRLSWDSTLVGNSVTVRVVRTSSAGSPVVITRNALTGRSYFHEGDYFYSGLAGALFGLDAGTSYLPSYSAYISGGGTNVIIKNFAFDWNAPLVAPSLVWPAGSTVYFSQNSLVWSQSVAVTRDTLEIRYGSTNGVLVYNSNIIPPTRDMDGLSRFDMPFYPGETNMPNGVYYWKVIAANPRQTSSPSAWQSFTIDLQNSPVGAYGINGEVRYYGKVTNGVTIVQAFRSMDFSGSPDAQIELSRPNSVYNIRGLRTGVYYVRSFLDQNGNKKLDTWETSGVVRDLVGASYYFQPAGLELPGNQFEKNIIMVFHDTDNDGIADDWEYARFGTLATANGSTDSDSDGLSDYLEYAQGTNPLSADSDGDGLTDGSEYFTYHTNPLVADTDGDGLSDGAEVNTYGTNPLNNDTDGDGLVDGFEVLISKTSPLNPDQDGDGYGDAVEIVQGYIATNALSHPSNTFLLAISSLVPGPIQDAIAYNRVPTATGIVYRISTMLEVKTNLLQSSWDPIVASQRSIYPTNWLGGPWGYTNVHGSSVTATFYNVRWSVPYP